MFSYPDPETLLDILDNHYTQLEEMLAILKKEEQALRERDIETFENAVEQKQQQLQKLEELEKHILPFAGEKVAGDAGQGSAAEHMATFIDSMPESSIREKVRTQWTRFQALTRQCNEQNEINNRVLIASRVSLQQALDILRGESSTPNLYGASGRSSESGQRQTIGVA